MALQHTPQQMCMCAYGGTFHTCVLENMDVMADSDVLAEEEEKPETTSSYLNFKSVFVPTAQGGSSKSLRDDGRGNFLCPQH